MEVLTTDTLGRTGSYYFILDVANTAPEITTISDIPSTIAGSLYLNDYDSTDDDQGSVTWSLNTNATWLNIGTTSGQLMGTPSNSHAGTYWVIDGIL